VWFPDGHAYFRGYYVDKAHGVHRSWTAREIDEDVDEYFRGTRVNEKYLRVFRQGIHRLHAKGYTINLFWEPIGHAFATHARHRYADRFELPIEAVERMKGALPVDRYLAARETIDAERFGCGENDALDQLHVDVDCLSRFFALSFPRDSTVAGAAVAGHRR
jgi:hypothetical protein